MKLLLCNDKRIKTYNLTNGNEDGLTIDYYDDSDIYETISLKKHDDTWFVEQTANIEIIDKQNVCKIYEKKDIHFLSINKTISLYIVPSLDNYSYYSIGTLPEIKIGNTTDCNILFSNIEMQEEFAKIKKEGNYSILENPSENKFIYINNRIIKKKKLCLGDTMFINGLNIIWMDDFIMLSGCNKNVVVKGLQAYIPKNINESYNLPSEYERNIKLFSDNQVFFHSPRMQLTIEEETVKLDPPPEESQDKYNRMPLLLTLGSSSIICITSCATGIVAIRSLSTNNGDVSGNIIELIICTLMIFISLAIPIMTNKWEKNREKNKENLRRNKYTSYLDNKKQQVEKIIKTQSEIINDNNLTLEEIQKRIVNGASTIWPREISDNDFLDVRIGVGDIKAKINVTAPSDQFFLYDDDLRDQAMDLANSKKLLTNVPITLSLVKNKIVSFIFDAEFKDDYINGIMLQLMYYYSPKDLKIVIFTDEDSSSNWEYMKYIPHIWSAKRDIRFFSENYNESIQLSSYLDQIYDKRITIVEDNDKKEKKEYEDKSKLYLNYDEYYLIVTDNFEEAKSIPIINRILNSNSNVGFSLLVFGSDIKKMPSKLDRFVYINNKNSAIYLKNLTNNDQSQFKAEYIDNLNINALSKQISNIPVDYKISGYNLPESISFMDMLHAGKLSHLNITKKWIENDPTTSLYAPVGIKDNGKLIGLDLHEKVHGPHGLIAGSTGSGKSEFIITFLLSLAINYSPNEVQFILIDYKGGGLAGAFENRVKGIKIPHLVGTITNLDTSEINRTLVSIQSELKRRQKKFNEARELLNEGTIDIYKYQKMYREGKIKEPMSHLFVVCDEFAELKQQQPDFMSELISTSRIGRSLGVHLILATQKPSGVVDDQIWSNARFKVCLKVQTEVDSNEMLKRPDAAFIKETGRFYLQVGNNELFEYGQSAWTGAKYIPVEHVRNKIDDSINFISNSGLILKTVNEDFKNNNSGNSQEQLVSIVNYLYEIGKKENYNFTSLWLPSLAKEIYMSQLIKKYKYVAQKNVISSIIGEYDKPAKQEQGLYELNINSNNTVVFGTPNSGKELILSNIIYTACLYHTPRMLNIYIIDFGSGYLNPYLKFPHVGDIITVSNKEKVLALYQYLDKEISRRKEIFAEYGGNYDAYIKNSGKNMPLLLTIINSFESYMENCYDQEDYLNSLLREGSKYGIVFITSAISTSSIRSTVLEYYSTKIILQTNDKFDYYYILGAPSELLPKRNFGRGLAKINDDVCEFQTAIISDDSILIDAIKKAGAYMQEYYKYKVPPVKILPQKVTLNSMFKYAKQITKIPLGYTRDDVSLYYYNFIASKVTSIIGNNVTNDIRFMCSIIDLIDTISNVKMNIFDFLTCIKTDGKAKYYSINFLDAFNEILEQKEQVPTINIIIGIGNIFDVLDSKEKEAFDKIISNIDKLNNQYMIIFDNNDRFSKVVNESWFNKINRNYIWVGKYIDSQNIFDISNISTFDIEEKLEDMIYVIDDNHYYVIKGVGGIE